ncbi:prepilin peptidase, partial [Arthrospira platensis SPKY1]|nr:prepilin peptidase [Arthrospira platensis SPKY1]
MIGGLIGSALLLWIALGAEAILRKEAMGFGDVKLLGAIGAFCGWQGAVFAIFGGAVLGMLGLLLVGCLLIATGKLRWTAVLDLQGAKMP